MRLRAVVAGLLALTLLGACGGPKTHLELGMRSVSITAPRLITPAIELVPAAPVPAAAPAAPSVLGFLPSARQAPAAKAPPCPAADEFAVPDRPASQLVASPPAADAFVQLSDGSYSSASGKGKLTGAVGTAVTAATTTTNSSNQKLDQWAVAHADVANKAAWVEEYRLVHAAPGGGGTSPGVWLVGLAWADPVRGKMLWQAEGNGIQVLPSPIQAATNDAQYIGADTDPNTLATLELTRNVRGRKRVDACGHLIDTITDEMTGTLTTAQTSWEITWTVQWATAFGAADVEDTFGVTNPLDGTTLTRTVRNVALPKAVPAS